MIELFEQDIRTNDRQSSKGNQLKWENSGIWYKADYTGYEGLAEYMISHLMQKSTLSENEIVLYEPEQIRYRSGIYTGVKSRSFLEEDWQIITLERLFWNFFGQSLYKAIFSITNCEERLRFLAGQVERITGLADFGIYMNKLLTLDALFLNEDRHTHNIAVLMDKKGKFRYCPVFDNGAGLLSDITLDYPLSEDVYQLIPRSKAKTISADYDEQLDVSERLYGNHIRFRFTKQDVDELLEAATVYPEEVKERVRRILFWQMKKYRYLFE